MTQVRIITLKNNDYLGIESPYNPDAINLFKNIGCKWNESYWIFNKERKKEIKNSLVEFFGYCGTDTKTVEIEIDCDQMEERKPYFFDKKIVRLHQYQLMQRRSRDTTVNFSDGVFCRKGMFLDSGGSNAHPRVDSPEKQTILVVKKFPEGILPKLSKDEREAIQVIRENINPQKSLKEQLKEALNTNNMKALAELIEKVSE